MKPGRVALVFQRDGRGREVLEGVGTLERRLRADEHGDGRERWSLRWLDGSGPVSREVRAGDVLEDRAQLEEELERRGLA